MVLSRFVPAVAAAAFLFVSFCPSVAGLAPVSSGPGLEYPEYDSPRDIPAHVFARDNDLTNVLLSPDGKFLLRVQPRDNLFHINVVPVDQEDTREYLSIHVNKAEFRRVAWGSKNRIILVNEAFRWGRNWSIVRNRVVFGAQHDSQNTERLLHVAIKKEKAFTPDTIIHFMPDDPDRVLVTYSEDGKAWPALYELDIYTGETEKVADGHKYIYDWYADQDGVPRFGLGWEDFKLYMVARTDADTKWTALRTDAIGDPERFAFLGFDPEDMTQAFVRSSKDSNLDKIFRIDLRTGAIGDIVYETKDIDAGWLVRNPTGRKLLAAYTRGDRLEKSYFDEEYERIDRSLDKALTGRDNYINQVTPDGKAALVYSSSPTHPGAYYFYDMENYEVSIFAEANPALNPDYLSPVKSISYTARDGLTIPAYLTLPKDLDPKALPLVVMPHGGPWVRDHQEYDFWVQFIASRGYAVLQPNFRGSDGFGREFENAGHGEWGGKMIDDMADGVEFLAKEGLIDKDRVCIAGASYGGYAAIMSSIRYGTLYKCALAVSPVTDLSKWAKTLKERGGRDSSARIAGKNGRRVFKSQNPVKRTSEVAIPLVLMHGTADYQVPFEHAEKFAKRMEKNKIAFKFVKLENEGHGMNLARSRTRVLRETERVLDKYLAD